MKKVLVLLFTFLALFGSYFATTNAWIFDGIFQDKNTIPYCNDGKCWFIEWINEIWKSNIDWVITKGTASDYIQRVVVYLLRFLALVAVIVIIYAWFNILTAAWEDEKVKKSKSMILYAIVGLAIIFLAWPITTFIIGIFTSSN
jgi:hypothetical protein